MSTKAYRVTEGQISGILEMLKMVNSDAASFQTAYKAIAAVLRSDPIDEAQLPRQQWQWIPVTPYPVPHKPGDWPCPDWSRPTCKTVIKPAGMTEEEALKKTEAGNK